MKKRKQFKNQLGCRLIVQMNTKLSVSVCDSLWYLIGKHLVESLRDPVENQLKYELIEDIK